MKGSTFRRCGACKRKVTADTCCPGGTVSWAFVVDVRPEYGSGRDRKQIKRTGFPRKKDAEAALAELVSDTHRGTYTPPSKVTVGEFAATFLGGIDAQVKAGSLAANTAADYRRSLERHALPHVGNLLVQELRPSHLTAMYGTLADTLATKTISNVARTMHRMLEGAIDDGIIQGNPAKRAKAPTVKRTAPDTLDADQLGALLRYVDTDDRDNLALIMVAATSGLRRGEVMGLPWQQLDLDAGTARIEQQVTTEGSRVVLKRLKTATSHRTIPLHPAAVAALRQHRTRQLEARLAAADAWQDNGLVFPADDGTPRRPKHLNTVLTRALKRANLPHVTVHGLRHSFASVLLDQGEAIPTVSALLGHSSPAITMNVYAHKIDGADRRAVDAFGASVFRQTEVS